MMVGMEEAIVLEMLHNLVLHCIFNKFRNFWNIGDWSVVFSNALVSFFEVGMNKLNFPAFYMTFLEDSKIN